MGNYLACGPSIRVSDTASTVDVSDFVRLVHPDGTLQYLESPVSVAELMLDHPQHFVCDESSNRPLPADHQLDPCQIYYLTSNTKGARKIAPQNQNGGPLIGMKQIQGGVTQVTVSQDFVTKFMSTSSSEGQEEQFAENDEDHLQAAHRMRMSSLRCTSWRPKLATIDEYIY